MTAEIGKADVFISHAHEDKEVARPLAEALRERGLTVWYDEYVLRLGDKLRATIERGLATARFGVVILSPNFFAKEWPQRELDAFLTREMAERSKLLLPVWHNLTQPEIVARSPILADRVAVSTVKGLAYTVEKILQVLEYGEARGGSTGGPLLRPPESVATRLPSPGEERIHEKDGSVLVYVPGGEYVLGTDDLSENEKPVHRVVLSPFWIGKYEVTNEQYGRFLSAVPGTSQPEYWRDRFKKARKPVIGVSWEEAKAYCSWAGLALPSEAQWEAAARGEDRRHYPWGNKKPTEEYANFDYEKGKTTAVGSFPRGAGPFGTLDQAGNVWEWCEDVWDKKAYQAREGAKDPVNNSGKTTVRCLRGGSWVDDTRCMMAAYRFGFKASFRDWHIGFRCVLPSGAEP